MLSADMCFYELDLLMPKKNIYCSHLRTKRRLDSSTLVGIQSRFTLNPNHFIIFTKNTPSNALFRD